YSTIITLSETSTLMKPYPSFIPPDGIGERQPDEWSSAEAKKYFEWLLRCIDERTTFLVEYFDEKLSTPAEALIRRLGEKVREALRSPPFAETGTETALSNAGFALAADMGLLVARSLLADQDVNAQWILVKAKRSINYNQPVLKGSSKVGLNPVFC